MEPSGIYDLLSGRRRGLGPTLLRAGLACLEPAYCAAIWWRNRRYDRRPELTHRVPAPVVSVGNITTGGTGKTPLVAWLARWFRQRNVRVAVISRGYGAEDGALNDEALELEIRLPDVPHLQNPDRVAAAQIALEELESQLLLLDDAFQHRRIARDLDIVLLDALQPFGFEHVLPRGLLREPLSGLKRADVVALSRADQVDAARRSELQERVEQYAPDAAWIECAHRPTRLVNCRGEARDLAELAREPAAAFCGIGNPAAFQRTLDQAGVHVVGFHDFPDHHPYASEDVDQLAAWLDQLPTPPAAILCTVKDLVKLQTLRLAGVPLWAVEIELAMLRGEEALVPRLERLLPEA